MHCRRQLEQAVAELERLEGVVVQRDVLLEQRDREKDLLLEQHHHEKAMLDACADEAASEIERLREVDPRPYTLSLYSSLFHSVFLSQCRVQGVGGLY